MGFIGLPLFALLLLSEGIHVVKGMWIFSMFSQVCQYLWRKFFFLMMSSSCIYRHQTTPNIFSSFSFTLRWKIDTHPTWLYCHVFMQILNGMMILKWTIFKINVYCRARKDHFDLIAMTCGLYCFGCSLLTQMSVMALTWWAGCS